MSSPGVTPTTQSLEREYQELCSNMRHYGNARLTRLTMLFALSGALLALLYGKGPTDVPVSLIKLAGLLLAVLFWAVDFDVVFNWRCFRDRAIDVEAALGLQQYTARRNAKASLIRCLVSETNATYAFYALLTTFWLFQLFTRSG